MTTSIFPLFIFNGDASASEQIQEYCTRWYEKSTASRTFINVVYLANSTSAIEVPDFRIYEVIREIDGFRLVQRFDLIAKLCGSNRILNFLPIDFLMNETYFWRWVDAISYEPVFFPSNQYVMPSPEWRKVPLLTPDGWELFPLSRLLPAGLPMGCPFYGQGGAPGRGAAMPDDFKAVLDWKYAPWSAWSYLGCSYYQYSWSTTRERFPEVDLVPASYGWAGLGEVVARDTPTGFSFDAVFFNKQYSGGGCFAVGLIETIKNVPSPAFSSSSSMPYIEDYSPYSVAPFGSYYFESWVEMVTSYSSPGGGSFDRFIYDRFVESSSVSPSGNIWGAVQVIVHHVCRARYSLCELFPWLPRGVVLPPPVVPSVPSVPPLLPGVPGVPGVPSVPGVSSVIRNHVENFVLRSKNNYE